MNQTKQPTTTALGFIIIVAYRIEKAEGGYRVWRRSTNGEELAIAAGARGKVYLSLADARQGIAAQKKSDRAAATRLGIELRESEEVGR